MRRKVMRKLRYETVPYNHVHGLWNPANMWHDIDEAFEGKPEEKAEYILNRIEALVTEIKLISLKEKGY
tara:strand:+ start:667 stop:873 length:207 start_codon:yes stop_codon:yes gene_type:complete